MIDTAKTPAASPPLGPRKLRVWNGACVCIWLRSPCAFLVHYAHCYRAMLLLGFGTRLRNSRTVLWNLRTVSSSVLFVCLLFVCVHGVARGPRGVCFYCVIGC